MIVATVKELKLEEYRVALTPQGFVKFHAKSVVLACGSFEANAEMRARYLGPNWDLAKVRGTRYNTGVGIVSALQAGALPGSPIRGAAGCAFAPYNIPNVHSKGYDVVSNRSKVAAYRAPGAPIGAFSVESVLDELAEKLQMDPLQLRLKNAAKQGTKAAHGPVYPVIGYEETLRRALASDHYKSPLKPNQGRGVACGNEPKPRELCLPEAFEQSRLDQQL